MNRTVWIFPTLVLAGLVVLIVWIQRGQLQPQAAAINNTVTVIATRTSEPELPTATATSTGVPPTATASPVPSPTPTIVNLTPLPTTISGVVIDEQGAVAEAIVQLHGQPAQFKTAKDGAFVINGISGTTPLVITAWSDGHYIGSTTVNPSARYRCARVVTKVDLPLPGAPVTPIMWARPVAGNRARNSA